MTSPKKLSQLDVERQLIEDAFDDAAWVYEATVSPSRSPRPILRDKRPDFQRRVSQGAVGFDAEFKKSFDRYYLRVVHYFERELGVARDQAEDFAQDVFARFYKASGDRKTDASWPFIATVARVVATNQREAKKTESRLAQVISIDDLRKNREASLHLQVEPPARADELLLRARLHDAIAALPQGQRQCLQLWLDGFKYDEIAAALRISNDAVKSRLRDAKAHLRSRLESDGLQPARRSPSTRR